MQTRGRVVGVLVVVGLVLAACGGGAGDDTAKPADSGPAPGVDGLVVDGTVDQKALDEYAAYYGALGQDEQMAHAAELSATLEGHLYEMSGLTEALGGAEPATAAIDETGQQLAELSDGLEQDIAGAQAQPAAYLRPAADDGPSLGQGLFAGMIVGSMGTEAAISATSDGKEISGELASGGKISNKDGTAAFEIDHTEVDSHGVSTTLKTRNVVTPCPAPDGTFTASASVDVTTSVNNGATGKRATMDVEITGSVDDNADLVGYDTTSRTQYADFANHKGGFLDLTISLPREGAATSTVNRTGGDVSKDIVDNAVALSRLMAGIVPYQVAHAAEKAWQSGRCVELKPTVSAGPKGLKPGASVEITAAPRSKMDGGPTGGTVTALLTGGGAAVTPSSTKVKADASFTYDAPGEKDKTGTVSLEARSKRGVGKATIEFDTKKGGYVASGGTTVTFTGTIPDLESAFTLQGKGPGFTVEFSFTPKNATSGALAYTGSGGGVTLKGSGTYTITGDDPVLTLNYNANGCATPGGCRATSNAITLTAVTTS